MAAGLEEGQDGDEEPGGRAPYQSKIRWPIGSRFRIPRFTFVYLPCMVKLESLISFHFSIFFLPMHSLCSNH